jgi:hypothetical protein
VSISPRALSITYGGLTIGTGVYEVHGLTALALSFDGIQYTFDVLVSADSDAAFGSAIDALETALRKRDQNLLISANGQSWGDYQSGVNALNTSAAINKAGDIDADTGRSRVYSVTFSAGHAADDLNGLRSINTDLGYAPSRQKLVTITGEYTALNGDLARKNYDDHVSTWVSNILTYVDNAATFELQGEEVTWDRNNHVLTFSQVWGQVIHDQVSGTLDDPRIVSHRCVFTRTSAYPGDASCDANRPETILAEYSAFVNIEEMDNQLGDLDDLWESTIYPWMREQVTETWDIKGLAATVRTRQFDPSSARFTSQVTFMAYMEGSDVIESTRNETYEDTRQIDYTPVWNDDELAAYADQAFLVRMRYTTVTETKFGTHTARPLLTPGNVLAEGWNKLSGRHSAAPLCIGEGDDQVQVTTLSEIISERFTRTPGGYGGTVPANVDGVNPSWDRGESARITEADIRRSRQITAERTGGTLPGSGSAQRESSSGIPQARPNYDG